MAQQVAVPGAFVLFCGCAIWWGRLFREQGLLVSVSMYISTFCVVRRLHQGLFSVADESVLFASSLSTTV